MCKIVVLVMTIFAKLGITGDKDARLAEYEHRLARATADAGEHSASVADWQAKKRRRPARRTGCYCTTTACGTKHCKCVAAGVMCTADCSCEGDPSKCRNQHNHAHAAAPAGAAPPHYAFIDDDDDFVELRGAGHPSLFVKMAGAVVRFFAKAKPAAKAPLPPPPTLPMPPPPADKVCSLSVSVCLSHFFLIFHSVRSAV